MSSEDGLWENLREKLRCKGTHAIRVENSVGPGTPDVNICLDGREVWVELKHVHEWPARQDTLVDIGLRPDQVTWLGRRGRAGGNVWILVQVGTDYLLFWWKFAPKLYIGVPRSEMESEAVGAWSKRINMVEFKLIVRGI